MNTPYQKYTELNPEQKSQLHYSLCLKSLEVWNVYTIKQKKIVYTEMVCGTRQVVDNELPIKAYKAACKGKRSRSISQSYLEPMSAIQDDDLAFPENIEYAYYSIYNFYNKYSEKEDIDDWIIVNQALSSETLSEDGYKRKLEQEIEQIIRKQG